MLKKLSIVLTLAFLMAISLPLSVSAVDDTHPGFKVQGRFLYDKAGEKVIPYGIDEMTIWADIDGDPTYSEIAKTGANSVRIVWSLSGSVKKLDTAIYNCRKNHMIPIIELHDATGEMGKLQSLVDFWIKPETVEVIKKHQEYLIVNIGNEVGNSSVSQSDFKSAYEKAVSQMRTAGIHVPLMIDASSWGQDIDMLQATGPYLIQADPDHNLLFSVHMWWPLMYGGSDQKVIDEIKQSVDMELPLIVGEFGNQWDTTSQGAIPYKTILEQCHLNQVGYLAWSWGPGNTPQTFLDMTTKGTFDTLRDWGLEVCLNNKHSIKNIAVRPSSMLTDLPDLPEETIPAGSIATGKPVVVSSTEPDLGNVAANAVDGKVGTRWASEYKDPQYIYVDLGSETEISRVYILWETACASQYKIQVSNDANNWTDIYTEYNGNGDIDDIKLTGKGRYVRVYCMQRATTYGDSIFELGIYSNSSPKVTLGDLNKDTNINLVDALIVKKYIVKKSTLTDEQLILGDVDANGSVNSIDYLLIKQFITGKTSVFPGQK